MKYSEPRLSYLVLDFQKPEESRLLLESLHAHTKFPFKIIYLHNGPTDYAQRFLDQGLIDQLVVTRKNNGLGIGTRNLFAACFTKYAIYAQNDQFLGREFTEGEFDALTSMIDKDMHGQVVTSIGLAGAPCGTNVYSERAHLIKTAWYKGLEKDLGDEEGEGLPNGGAGPYHADVWREGWMQSFFKNSNCMHWTYPNPLFGDNGKTAMRQNPDGSVWQHYPDTKQLWLVRGPVIEKYVYPKFTDEEWVEVIRANGWPAGKIPANEVKDSFQYWHKLPPLQST